MMAWKKINAKYQVFSEVRGKGLLLGAVLNEQYQDAAVSFCWPRSTMA